ncbi:hypothetical protein C8A05DRAFT_15688 [Staphylotrichum tortipilum]|uniref:Uncharacterized protein n=1 Tax=Staphylotrichum tortipilum TaxID=2831512 RepID=A0AAN6RSX4_9PEZI|nr:hypothetical protein C8A05DRAFT_15688 [Staphylotrichum longicolle]
MATARCESCADFLVFTLSPDDDDPNPSSSAPATIPDDLALPCGCHFHWQCLLDKSASITATLTCPNCASYLPSGGPSSSSSSSTAAQPTPSILTHYTNEGGVQPSLDIYPTLLEESFLSANPSARPARAFHTLAAEGEVQGMVELLTDLSSPDSDSDDDDVTPLTPAQLLAWRDPLNGLRSALHVALEAGQEEAVWLLLWLGSAAKGEDFPGAVVEVARGLGLPRRGEGILAGGGEDVRFVRDERGRSAEDVCLELGAPWTRLVEGGLFT